MEEKPTEQPTNELEKGKEETVVKAKKKDGRGKPRTEAQKAATARMLARKEEVRASNRKAKADAKEKEIEDAVEKRIKNKKTIEKEAPSSDSSDSSSSSDEDPSPPPPKRPSRKVKAKRKNPVVQYHNYYYGNTSSHQSSERKPNTEDKRTSSPLPAKPKLEGTVKPKPKIHFV